MNKPKAILIEQMVIITMVMVIAACVMVPRAAKGVESAIWTEARLAAAQIKQIAQIFCSEKGSGWAGWKDVSIYELGFTPKDLDGYYFKNDSYSILFMGHNNFLITIKVTPTTKGAEHFNRRTLTLDEQGNWGYIDIP